MSDHKGTHQNNLVRKSLRRHITVVYENDSTSSSGLEDSIVLIVVEVLVELGSSYVFLAKRAIVSLHLEDVLSHHSDVKRPKV